MSQTCVLSALIHILASRLKRNYKILCIGYSIFTGNVTAQSQTIFLPDSSATYIISNIVLVGNKTTKRNIILRELAFYENDTIKGKDLQGVYDRSRQNLMNTLLFNFVFVTPNRIDDTHLEVLIEVTERWYIWPKPIFSFAEPNFNIWWEGKNFSRTNYGAYLTHDNFRGRREMIVLKLQSGWSQQFAFQYKVPYLDRKQATGVTFTMGYSRNHEINYGTNNHNRKFYKNPDNIVRDEFFARISGVYRQKIYTSHLAELQYTQANVTDTVMRLASDYFILNKNEMRFLSFFYQFKYDHRDFKTYPLNGYMLIADFAKHGLWLFNKSLNVFTTSFRYSHHLKLTERFFFAGGAFVKLSLFDNPPYFLQGGLGYADFVRGYEYYVIDGQRHVLFRSNFKFQLLKTKSYNFEFIPTEKFSKIHYALYFNIHADAGYVSDKLYYKVNPYSNTLLAGTGIGLDFVTYYDIVIRGEYSLNRLGEHGFFLHFVKSI